MLWVCISWNCSGRATIGVDLVELVEGIAELVEGIVETDVLIKEVETQ